MRTRFSRLAAAGVAATLGLASGAAADTPDWQSLVDAGGRYAADDRREILRARQHPNDDLPAIAKRVTQLALPDGASVVSTQTRGVGPATIVATHYRVEGVDRMLSVSVASRAGGGALSLAHTIDPAMPRASQRISDSAASMLMAAMQGGRLVPDTHGLPGEQAEPASEPTEIAVPREPAGTVAGQTVERVLFDLDYQYGVGGAAYPVYKPVVLFANGEACQCLEYAIEDIDIEPIKRREPGKTGRWRRSGSDYEVRWTGSKKAEMLKASVGPPRELPSAASLRGHYQRISGGGNTALGGDVLSVTTTDLIFQENGRYRRGGSRLMQSNAGVAAAENTAEGRWSLSGSTLTLEDNDGNTMRTSVFYSAKRKTTASFGAYGVLWIGGRGYQRIE